MLRRPYTIDTSLAQPLSSRAASAYLTSVEGLELEEGDWAYLKLEEYGKVEIVKVIHLVGATAYLVRGVDNTSPQDFANPRVTYVLTAAEIYDVVPSSGELTLYADGAVAVSGTEVDVPRPLIGYIGVHYSFGSDSVIRIGRQENAYGCCGADNDIGSLGFGIFYLTSLPYPVEATESLGIGAVVDQIDVGGQQAHEVNSLNLGFSLSVLMRVIIHETEPLEALDLTFVPTVFMKVVLRTTASVESIDLGFGLAVTMKRILVTTEPQESVDLTYGLQSVVLY